MKVVVGISGGVDSAVAASLLQRDGHDVLAVHMQNWSDERNLRGCSQWSDDRKDAVAVAAHLGMPLEILNFEKDYQERVMKYFFREYAAGRTPNPDMLCNREIKFGILLDWAMKRGFDAVATGHYARVKTRGDIATLHKGVDTAKDQSYFLSQLSQQQLRHAIFPLGDWVKSEVRSEARRLALPVARKPDSQGLCFVGDLDIAAILKETIPTAAGDVVTPQGAVIGRHEGAALYTVGQRRGVGVSGAVPLYVLKTDVKTNIVTVGHDRDLYTRTVITEKPHWVAEDFGSGEFDVSIRYRMEASPAQVTVTASGSEITFDEEQRGPTPGQFAALYSGSELVGSAVIR